MLPLVILLMNVLFEFEDYTGRALQITEDEEGVQIRIFRADAFTSQYGVEMDIAGVRRLQLALAAYLHLIAADGRRCVDCHRRSDDLAQGADGQWRGPSCRRRYEAGVGVQLPIGGQG